MTEQKVDVVVWRECGNDPDRIIIHGVCGEVTLDTLKDIEEMFNDPDKEFNIPPAPDGYIIGVRCSVYWDSGETQYGDAHGSVITFDGYWYQNIVGYVVVELSMSMDTDDTVTYFPRKDFDTNLLNHVYVATQQKINNNLDLYFGDD